MGGQTVGAGSSGHIKRHHRAVGNEIQQQQSGPDRHSGRHAAAGQFPPRLHRGSQENAGNGGDRKHRAGRQIAGGDSSGRQSGHDGRYTGGDAPEFLQHDIQSEHTQRGRRVVVQGNRIAQQPGSERNAQRQKKLQIRTSPAHPAEHPEHPHENQDIDRPREQQIHQIDGKVIMIGEIQSEQPMRNFIKHSQRPAERQWLVRVNMAVPYNPVH